MDPHHSETESMGASSDNPKVTIIGGGIAALTAAEAARETSESAEVTMVFNEPSLPYTRLNLTKYIAGETGWNELNIHDEEWYAQKRIILVMDEAISIDRKAKAVALRNGGHINYIKLIIATGSAAFVPQIPGAGLQGVMTLRTLSDAVAIIEHVKPGTECVCIGGGLLGIELAAGLRKRGAEVTVLESFGWLMSRQLAQPAGLLLRKNIEELGINILCGVKAGQIAGAAAAEGVILEGGERIAAELVLISAGVRPNIALAKACGLEIDRGLKVDERMLTSDPAIFAAGDVAEHKGAVHGLWPVAMEQGTVAGINAAGGNRLYKQNPPPAFLKVAGIDVFSIGDFSPESHDVRFFEEAGDGKYLRLAMRSGVIVGANMVGDISAARLVKTAVERAIPVKDNPAICKMYPGLQGTE